MYLHPSGNGRDLDVHRSRTSAYHDCNSLFAYERASNTTIPCRGNSSISSQEMGYLLLSKWKHHVSNKLHERLHCIVGAPPT